MSRASSFVQSIPHEDFMRLLSSFCLRKDVTHLMTYGIDYIDAEEKESVKQAVTALNFKASSDTEVEDFCRALHGRAVQERG